ncbi:MAG TPA: hypothetical protein VHV51_01195 [Polyangiaceae bacterium]|nr:hypothetical protein [Polyangiaceae bacterium]
MTWRARRFSPWILSVLFVARAAHAEPGASELSNARQAFQSAVALEGEQKWALAAQKLHEAISIKDTPGLRFHLAHCEERLGSLVEAALDYERANELLRHGAKAPDVEKLLGPASAELKPRVPHLTLQLPADVANPLVVLDGKQVAPSELSSGLALNPGAHQLKVSAPGRMNFERAFSLKEADRVSIAVSLPSEQAPGVVVPTISTTPSAPGPAAQTPAAEPPPSAKPPAPSSPRAPAKLYLLIGESAITVAGLAVGIGYSVAGSSASDRVLSTQAQIDQAAPGNAAACSAPNASLSGSCANLRSAIDDHDRDGTVSAIGFICAGAGAAALVTTWLAYPRVRASGSSPAVEPVVALGRVGLVGRF